MMLVEMVMYLPSTEPLTISPAPLGGSSKTAVILSETSAIALALNMGDLIPAIRIVKVGGSCSRPGDDPRKANFFHA